MTTAVPHAASSIRRPTTGRRKVVLYNPDAVFFTMPLALLAVGSHLDRSRFDVVIVDGRLESDPWEAVERHLEDALCLGVTVLTGAPIQDALRISRAAKAFRSDLPVIWGGWHPSMFGRECLDDPSVDVTVQGQGEVTFAEIVDRLDRGQSLTGCAGCTLRDENGVPVSNPRRALFDVDRLTPHDYSLIDVESYFELKGKRQIDYISSQGCRFRCAFCADPFVYDRQWSGVSPGRIGAEVEALWKEYRYDDLSFQDETFFTSASRVAAVVDEFLARNLPITWAATLRADQSHRLSEEVFQRCKQAGLRRVLIGVESGSQAVLDRIRKDVKLDHVFEAADRCLRYAVGAIFPFIVGFPDETAEERAASLAAAKRLQSMSADFEVPVFYFKPYPGSVLTQEAVKQGYQPPCSLDEWSRFDFVGSAGPWVTSQTYQDVERFKFYKEIAWRKTPWWQRPLQPVARWRCNNDRYGWPVEMYLSRFVQPPKQLS